MSVTMMIIVMVFVLTNIPRMSLMLYEVYTIPNILECYDMACQYHISSLRYTIFWKSKCTWWCFRWLLDSLVRYLLMLNSSINFLIYCFVGSNFRNTLFSLCKKSMTWSYKIFLNSKMLSNHCHNFQFHQLVVWSTISSKLFRLLI